jgi:hypothetical protein
MVRWEVKKEDILDWAMKKRKLLGTKQQGQGGLICAPVNCNW